MWALLSWVFEGRIGRMDSLASISWKLTGFVFAFASADSVAAVILELALGHVPDSAKLHRYAWESQA